MKRIVIVTLAALTLSTAPAAAEEEGEKSWGYDNGLYFRTATFEIKFGVRPQIRFTYNDFDHDLPLVQDSGEFRVRRAKFFASGWAYRSWLKFKLQFNAVGNDNVTGLIGVDLDPNTPGFQDFLEEVRRGFDLEDLYIDFAKNGAAIPRIGQYKVPFGIQFMTSSGRQEFVDRSLASIAFAPGRDVGAGLYGATSEKRFGYETGVFNGNGRNTTVNDNDKFMYVARIHLDSAGGYKLAESALENPQTVQWTVGAAWFMNSTDPAGDLDAATAEGFFSLRYRRFFVLTDYYSRTADEMGGGETDSDGYIAQVGFFFVPKAFEVALRYSEVDPDSAVDDDRLTEKRIAFNYYIVGHRMKVQVDYARLEEEQPMMLNIVDDQFRAQFQIIF